MARRGRKPPVKPEVRREWLRRYEEDGDSPPQIAAADHFDVRTVRKQISLAREEREVREARSAVLRNAVERHYRDLCNFAEDLDTEITRETTIPSTLKDSRMWPALREHLPRSPLWKKLGRWERVLEELANLENDTRQRLTQMLKADSRLAEIIAAGEDGVVPGMVAALTFQVTNWARGWQGLNIKENFEVKPLEEGLVIIQYGFAQMGRVQENHAVKIRETLVDFQSKIPTWKEYEDMKKLFTEVERLKLSLRDELAIIILRRIVPGKCKYCPI